MKYLAFNKLFNLMRFGLVRTTEKFFYILLIKSEICL